MEEAIEKALAQDTLIDITTTGRKTGRPHRIEIGFHYLDGKLYLTGRPGRRGWYANLLANPEFTLHLKQSVKRDLQGRATPITGKVRKRAVFERMPARGGRPQQYGMEERIRGSPLVEVKLMV